MEPISTASGPHETPSDRGKNLCVRRLASSDLLFRYVEEVSDLIAARIRRCHKFELEASSPSPLIGTISTSRKLPLFLRFSRSRVVLESLFVLAVGQMCTSQIIRIFSSVHNSSTQKSLTAVVSGFINGTGPVCRRHTEMPVVLLSGFVN